MKTMNRVQELAHKFNDFYNLRSDIEGADPIFPFLIMDIAYNNMFNSEIMTVSTSKAINAKKKFWLNNYNTFNKALYLPFNDDEKIELCDYMDDLEEQLSDKVYALHLQFMKELEPHVDTQVARQFLAATMVCRALTLMALTMFKAVYRFDVMHIPCAKRSMTLMIKNMEDIARLFYQGKTDVLLNNSPTLNDSITAVCNTLIAWLKKN